MYMHRTSHIFTVLWCIQQECLFCIFSVLFSILCSIGFTSFYCWNITRGQVDSTRTCQSKPQAIWEQLFSFTFLLVDSWLPIALFCLKSTLNNLISMQRLKNSSTSLVWRVEVSFCVSLRDSFPLLEANSMSSSSSVCSFGLSQETLSSD